MALNTLFSNMHMNNYDFNIDVDELTEDDPKAEHPDCNVKLRSHQLTIL